MATLTPEEILENIKQQTIEEEEIEKGKLKIFLGYSAGVGKTYHMLDLARELEKNGKDVVVGYVEKHDRKETLELLEGLEEIKTKVVPYKKVILNEFNLEEALKRKPELMIVDELAHTNARGQKNAKRYQDVEELLQAGIDVYTTLNIQHIESLNQKVEEITGIHVKETIPDKVVQKADNIELIDIEPEELLNRMNKGKIYRPDKVELAKENFFTKENLIKLREIALKYMINSVDRKNISISLQEEILVCVNLDPFWQELVKKTSKQAEHLHCAWTALYIQTKETEDLTEKQKQIIQKQQKLVKELGGKYVKIEGKRVVKQIKNYIKEKEMKRLVLAKEILNRKPIMAYRLLRKAENLEIYFL